MSALYLPSDVWEMILVYGGSLDLAALLGCSRRRIASMRIQRRWRALSAIPQVFSTGARVIVRIPGLLLGARVGHMLTEGTVSLCGKKQHFLFLPYNGLKMRRLSA